MERWRPHRSLQVLQPLTEYEMKWDCLFSLFWMSSLKGRCYTTVTHKQTDISLYERKAPDDDDDEEFCDWQQTKQCCDAWRTHLTISPWLPLGPLAPWETSRNILYLTFIRHRCNTSNNTYVMTTEIKIKHQKTYRLPHRTDHSHRTYRARETLKQTPANATFIDWEDEETGQMRRDETRLTRTPAGPLSPGIPVNPRSPFGPWNRKRCT